MNIKCKNVYIYKIIIEKKLFYISIFNTFTNLIINYEISEEINDIKKIVDFFWTNNRFETINSDFKKLFCGYNNIHYDNVFMNYLISKFPILLKKSGLKICDSLFNLNKLIIENLEIEKWKEFKYSNYYESFDLILINSYDFISINNLKISLDYKIINSDNKSINQDNVLFINKILNNNNSNIVIRLYIEEHYNTNVMSTSPFGIGMKIILKKYLEKTDQQWSDIKNLNSSRDKIYLNEIILNKIIFKTKPLNSILNSLKNKIIDVDKIKSFKEQFIIDKTLYTLSEGGLHSSLSYSKSYTNDFQRIIYLDVDSGYPNMMIKNKFYPPHLDPRFLYLLSDLTTERISAKKSHDYIKSDVLKMAITGVTGNLKTKSSWIYSPITDMEIKINMQLFLLMFIESLCESKMEIIQANTDGVFVILDNSKYSELLKLKNKWESISSLTLSMEEYKCIYQSNVNNYFGLKLDNTLVLKGSYSDKNALGKNIEPKAIYKAVVNNLLYNIPVKETIDKLPLREFMFYIKSKKTDIHYYNNIKIGNYNLFYISVLGGYLIKNKDLLINKKVGLINDLNDNYDDINYNYYISESNKIIESFKPLQLTLF